MKSLNRTLSLVLVLAMCLGLMGIATAATFTDNTAIKYTEAVDVMTGIGVINGMDTGKFDPTGNLTREQAAKLVCYLTMGKTAADALKASSAPFTDVAADRWSAGSIAYCVQQGIVAGNGDGTFAPTANVTGYQFSKMLLVALGYDASIEQFTGSSWSINVAKRAFANKLFTGNSTFNGNTAATREEASLYALNLIKANLVTYASKGSNITVNGAVINTGASAPAQTSGTFMNTYYSNLTKVNGVDALGRDAAIWTYKGTQLGKYASGADFTYTAAAAGLTDAAKIAAMGLTGYTIAGGSVTPSVNGAAGAAVTTLAQLAALTANGKVVEVYVNGANATQIDKIIVVNSYLAQVTSNNTVAKTVTVKTVGGATFTVDSLVSPTIYATLSKMAVKDYVLVTPVAAEIVGLATTKTVSGALTKITTNSAGVMTAVTVGGTSYNLSANQVDVSGLTSSTMTAKTNITLYLDSYGNAIYVTNATVATPYIAVVKVSQTLVNNSIINMATGYAPDGTAVTLNVGTASATKGSIYSYAAATSAEALANSSEYTLTAVTQLALKATLTSGKLLLTTGIAITAGSTTLAGLAVDGATAAIPYTSDVKFIFTDPATSAITVKTGAQACAAGTATALLIQKADGTFVIPVVYVNAAPADTTGSSILFLAKANGTEFIGGVAYNNYTAMIDGASTPIMTKADNTANIGSFCTYAKDTTTGAYTVAEYTTATGSVNSVYVDETIAAASASYLFTSTNLTNVNAVNATVVDLTTTGINSLSDINTLVTAGGTVKAAVVYNNLSTSDKFNTISYIYVTSVA